MAEAPTPTTEELAAAGLRLEIDGPVATITLARPERRNAMTGRTWTMLAHIGHSLPPSVRIVVITGAGPSFSAGIDLAMFGPDDVDGEPSLLRTIRERPEDRAAVEAVIAGYQAGFLWLRRPGIVSVAAVRGHAIGAGLQLALACDVRVLSDDARLCMKEPALGLVPDLTGTKPLVDLVGVNRAIELCLTARTVGAEEARELRLAELVVPGAELETAVEDLVAALLATPAAAATATKALLTRAPGSSLADQARAERAAQTDLLVSLAAATGTEAGRS
ncbi:enoyl-CoA hydratase/isomerase family protein [Marinitenerispora sediminis]|uniref:Enoyl-CoA hydratase n=1 Tax=Marinitenerispora sediminis TaxID=1931232 RepID=A0A368T099_9ACTN|nr:enoyl-CoA hydratase/isomerase family protein [Marinitenerispora sediminis]RCV48290.1 enoyl-CoA hydratase [Marinitenerispora sediminis]RCV49461.1 enoyl-CoA hydratase [Marinitenerispora sediminis]RCV52224.1 enoyl-CoA hydratase [Marinitenerispora sediminis]